MRKILTLSLILLFLSCAQEKEKTHVAEISCGQCQFGLKSQDGCDLAVRIDEGSYFVDGIDINDFGDAHNKETGFCEVIRNANVTGKVVDGRFKVSSINIIEKH